MVDQPPQKTEIASDNSNYMIHSRMEILYVLRAIQQKHELVTAYFNQGNDFILTSILNVDAENNSLILDYGADDSLNKRALASDKIAMVTAQERVKVQFVAERMEASEHLGRPAFKIGIPDDLLKLQRREYYRLATPVTNPVKCTLTKPGGKKADVVVFNISLGGIAISNYQNLIEFEVCDTFAGCRIVLPEIGTVTTGIEIREEREILLKNGAKTHRAGCMFIDLPPSQQAMIQRYIIKLERERRALLSQ